ncbi:MAG: hypothetical protein D6780_08760, partial [Candidatus Dadabacteria bacterium]
IKIMSYNSYYSFKLLSINNPQNEPIKSFDLFNIRTAHSPQSASDKRWADSASSEELFIAALPLTSNLICGDLADCTHFPDYCATYTKRCFTTDILAFKDAKGALLTTPKADYLAGQEEIAATQPSVPYFTLSDGNWFKRSSALKESYLFAKLTENNKEEILNLAKKGNFAQFVPVSALYFGGYLKPRSFSHSLRLFKEALQAFREKGIKVGLHIKPGVVEQWDNFINWASPARPVSEMIESYKIGSLSLDISSGQSLINIQLQESLEESETFEHFKNDGKEEFYLVNNELFKCESANSNQLINCVRARYGTRKGSHIAGSSVYLVPLSSSGYPFLRGALREASAKNLSQLLFETGASFLYLDGMDYAPVLPGVTPKSSEDWAVRTKVGFMPYLEALSTPVLIQSGSPVNSTIRWWYEARKASDDGAVFKSKEYTKYKLKLLKNNNPYGQYSDIELGWWRFAGSRIGEGNYDFDATSADEIHYLMTKVVAYDTSVGLQLDNSYRENAKREELFSLIGKYHSFLQTERSSYLLPASLREQLRNENTEAELKEVAGGYQFIQKKINRHYCSFQLNNCSYQINNPYLAQPATFKIKAVFDYYDFSDNRNLTIANSFNSSLSVVPSDESVSCYINEDGRVTVSTPSSNNRPGGCRITIPVETPLNLTRMRGLGIDLEGDGSEALVVVRLESKGFAVRDYKFMLDFTGREQKILGDPTGDNRDIINGKRVDWDGNSAKRRHWSFDWSKISSISLYVNNVLPGRSTELTIYGIKA